MKAKPVDDVIDIQRVKWLAIFEQLVAIVETTKEPERDLLESLKIADDRLHRAYTTTAANAKGSEKPLPLRGGERLKSLKLAG